jgi:chromodomain-helicase-DNA-binding protein 1
MRPVKHALKSLDNPDTTLSEDEQIRNAKKCLIEIGDRIRKCLEQYQNETDYNDWKT